MAIERGFIGPLLSSSKTAVFPTFFDRTKSPILK